MNGRSVLSVAVAATGFVLLLSSADAQTYGFAAPRQFDAGKTVTAVWPYADFDHDGLQDLASADTNHFLTIRRRDSTSPLGTPYASVTYHTETLDIGAIATDMAVAPLVDGPYPDVVLAAGGGIIVVENHGPPSAGAALQLVARSPLTVANTFLDHVRLADWDGTNGPDILATGIDASSHGVLAIFPNNGNGTWGAATVTRLTHPVENLAVCDFTFDGKPEVAVCYRDDNAVGVWQNPGDGTAVAVNETLISLPSTRPVAVTCADLVQGHPYFFPDLVVVGSARTQDGKNQITLTVAQNTSTAHTRVASFGTPASFALLPGVAGADTTFLSGASAADGDADGRPEIFVADYPNGKVADFNFSPTVAGGTVTSWGVPNVQEFACNGKPMQVWPASLSGSSYLDLVTCNDDGNGVNVLVGGAPQTPLNPAANLTLQLGKTGSSKYATVGTGTIVPNGSNCRFTCGNTNPGTNGLRIRVQSTTTPDTESSWTDLPGAQAGDMGFDSALGRFVLYQQNFPIGDLYFRTVSYAPGASDGLSSPIGPYTFEGNQPARLLLFTSITRPDGSTPANGSVPATARPGDALRVVATFRNEGDQATTADLWVEIPDGVKVTNANGAKQKLFWMTWTKILVPPHSGDQTRTFDVKVGDASTIGDVVESPLTAMDAKLKLALDKNGELKPTKPSVVLATVNNSVPIVPDLAVTLVPTPTTAAIGDLVQIAVTVTNTTGGSISNVKFVAHLRSDVEGVAGAYVDAQGKQLPGFADVDSSGSVFTFDFGTLAAGQSGYGYLYVHSTWDQPTGHTIPSMTDYELSGQTAGGAATIDRTLVAVPLTINAPATASAPRLDLVASATSFLHPDPYHSANYGDIPYAYPGEVVQFNFGIRNTGTAVASHCFLHAYVPAGTDLDMTSFGSSHTYHVTGPIPSSGTTYPGPAGITVDLGDVYPGEYDFRYQVKVRDVGTTGAPTPGDLLTLNFCSLSSTAFKNWITMRPGQVRVLVAKPMDFAVTKSVSTSGLRVGESMTFTYSITATGGVGAQQSKAEFGFPKYESVPDVATLDGAPIHPTAGKGSWVYDLATFTAGQTKTLVVQAKLDKLPPPTFTIVNTMAVSGVASTKASGPNGPYTLDVETTNVCDSSKACLCVVAAVDAIGGFNPNGNFQNAVEYVIAVGNLSDQTANNVVVQASVPPGTSVSPLPSNERGVVQKGVVQWKLGTLAPHSAATVRLPLTTGAPLTVGATVFSDVSVSASNAETKLSGRLASTLYDYGDLYPAVAAGRQLLVNGVSYNPGDNLTIDGAFAATTSDTINIAIRGADYAALGDDALLIALGGGNVLAFGTGTKVHPNGLSSPAVDSADTFDSLVLHHGTDLYHFVYGPADQVVLVTSACETVATAGDALGQLPQLVPCATAAVFPNGGGNIISLDGTRFVSNAGGALLDAASFRTGAGIVAQGAGNIVAAGGGNIVAAGGGNIVAAGGGNVAPAVPQGLAPSIFTSPSWIVAAGGGNIVAAGGGNIVAAGGGNIVAAGGGNIVAAGGGNVVAAGGGNIVAAGGGNIVAAGGGNIVAAGGGNIVAAGGGNIVAAGGGN